MRRFVDTLSVWLLRTTAAPAKDLEAGLAAYNRGDYAAAYRELMPLAEQGYDAAQGLLGVMYAAGRGVPQSKAQAVEWFRKAAEQGDADTQYNLGEMYRFGFVVPRSDVQAMEWFRNAAERGHARAQYTIGNMYANGRGGACPERCSSRGVVPQGC